MSLYDDTDLGRTAERVPGWSDSSLKLIQSQMRLKKAATTQPRREVNRKVNALAPVVDLKTKQREEEPVVPATQPPVTPLMAEFVLPKVGPYISPFSAPPLAPLHSDLDSGPEFTIKNEYDPMRPNEFDRVVRDIRRDRDREREKTREKERREKHERRSAVVDYSDEEADKEEEKRRSRAAGAAIAPPSSLQQNSGSPPPPARVGSSPGGSIAAMIMAKYGYKEGQGLGKSSQGISRALEVEKTSKRGGRIVHDKDKPLIAEHPNLLQNQVDQLVMPPPASSLMPPPSSSLMPPPSSSLMHPPVPPSPAASPGQEGAERAPTIAEILRNTTRIVLLRNMVGGGEVDEELEGEVKEECQTKYGEVVRVVIFEIPGAVDHEAVRIFVEFRRVENAIKALVDLNGRFFGGRQVCARFYDQDLFEKLDLSKHVP